MVEAETEAEASAAQPAPAAGDHPQPEGEALPRTASSKRRSRWGGETEKGLQVLQEVARSEDSVAVPAAAPASTPPGPAAEEEPAAKRRKSRWGPEEPKPASIIAGLPVALPSSLAHLVDVSPEVFDLQQRLAVVTHKLQLITQGKWVDERPLGTRSPSPEPVYNETGARINTREQRAKDALSRQRNELIGELIKAQPSYKPPADYRPIRHSRRIDIPVHEYPAYNFIGLILGPRGNTQKRMERETGAKIAIRGKGSVKEGRGPVNRRGEPLHDPSSDNDDLHVVITADTEEAVEKAADMVRQLVVVTDDDKNAHKQAQLRELAELNGTFRDLEGRKAALMAADEGADDVYRLPEDVKKSMQAQYERDVVAVHGADAAGCMEEEYNTFLHELGGDPRMADGPLHTPPGPPGSMRRHDDRDREDPTNLFVGNLPHQTTEDQLGSLFAAHGHVVNAHVARDRASGESRGFGFVRMGDVTAAAAARQALDGYSLAGRRLSVRVKGQQGPDRRMPPMGGGPWERPPPSARFGPGGVDHGPGLPPTASSGASTSLPMPPPGGFPPPPPLEGEDAPAEASRAGADGTGAGADAKKDAAAAWPSKSLPPPPGLSGANAQSLGRPDPYAPGADAYAQYPPHGGYHPQHHMQHDPYYAAGAPPAAAAAAAAGAAYSAVNADGEPLPPGEEDSAAASTTGRTAADAGASAWGHAYGYDPYRYHQHYGYQQQQYEAYYAAQQQYGAVDPAHFDADSGMYLDPGQDEDYAGAVEYAAGWPLKQQDQQGEESEDERPPGEDAPAAEGAVVQLSGQEEAQQEEQQQQQREAEPLVVVVALDPQEVERAKRLREEEEERQRRLREKQEAEQRRMQQMLEDRRKRQQEQMELARQERFDLGHAAPSAAAAASGPYPPSLPDGGAAAAAAGHPGSPRGRLPFRSRSRSPFRGRSPLRSRSPFGGPPGRRIVRRGSSPFGYRAGSPGGFRGRSYSRSPSPYGRFSSPYGRGPRRGGLMGRKRSPSPRYGSPMRRSPPLRSPAAAAAAAAAATAAVAAPPERESSPEEGEIEEGELPEKAPAPAPAPAAAAAPSGSSQRPGGPGQGPPGGRPYGPGPGGRDRHGYPPERGAERGGRYGGRGGRGYGPPDDGWGYGPPDGYGRPWRG